MITQTDVATRFKDTFQLQITLYGVTFDATLVAVMNKLIDNGAATLAEEGFLEDEAILDLAEAQLIGMVNKMIMETKKAGGSEVGMQMFAGVFGFCCPGCWPFC